jgi:hypothetical protein
MAANPLEIIFRPQSDADKPLKMAIFSHFNLNFAGCKMPKPAFKPAEIFPSTESDLPFLAKP